jgi:hypothetical protein
MRGWRKHQLMPRTTAPRFSTVCGEAITKDQLEFKVQFAQDGSNPGLDKFHIHVRCFAAWVLERPEGGPAHLAFFPLLPHFYLQREGQGPSHLDHLTDLPHSHSIAACIQTSPLTAAQARFRFPSMSWWLVRSRPVVW